MLIRRQVDLRRCCSHMAKTDFLMTWLSLELLIMILTHHSAVNDLTKISKLSNVSNICEKFHIWSMTYNNFAEACLYTRVVTLTPISKLCSFSSETEFVLLIFRSFIFLQINFFFKIPQSHIHSVEQIRWVFDDNLGIIFQISP